MCLNGEYNFRKQKCLKENYSNPKEEPPDDYFKCVKVSLKHVLKHFEINGL